MYTAISRACIPPIFASDSSGVAEDCPIDYDTWRPFSPENDRMMASPTCRRVPLSSADLNRRCAIVRSAAPARCAAA